MIPSITFIFPLIKILLRLKNKRRSQKFDQDLIVISGFPAMLADILTVIRILRLKKRSKDMWNQMKLHKMIKLMNSYRFV